MASDHTAIDGLKRELSEMRKLQMFDERTFAAAIRYVESNRDEVADYLATMSDSDVADLVLDLVNGGCGDGKCGS